MTRPILFSFFMFTVNLQPGDGDYARQLAKYMHKLIDLGYDGFDLPVAPPSGALDAKADRHAYAQLRRTLDTEGLKDIQLTTNVGATRTFDPSAPFSEQRALALAYLKSRAEITSVLRATAMAGPIVIPYGVYPTTDQGAGIWSDALQDSLVQRYANAQPIIQKLGEYAAEQGIKVAIEPVDHWETPGPNLVGEVVGFLDGVSSTQVGVCIDSAHVVLGSEGKSAFIASAGKALAAKRVHYIHLSAPDRGALNDSWIPWTDFLNATLPGYEGPLLVEVFNAIPVFLGSLRLTRRKFWIPGEDTPPSSSQPSAFDIAESALATVRSQLSAVGIATECSAKVLQI
jgi:sugar phosphate isomerase/epimerase